MPWKAIIDWLRGDRAAYTKVVMDGFKELSEERKKDAIERKQDNEKLSQQVMQLTDQVATMANHEANCHKMLIEANKQLRDNREQLIFIRKMMKDFPGNDMLDYPSNT